jgi:membrane protein implicated in regulation of membrane protease activity
VGRFLTFTVVYLKLLATFSIVGVIILGPLYLWNPLLAIVLWAVVALVLVPAAWRFDDAVRKDDSGTFKEPWR